MEIATLTRRAPDVGAARPARTSSRRHIPSLPAVALVALAVAATVGFFVYPTYPNYDSYYSLLWGRELLHGQTPSFQAYRSPTEHPLAIAFGLVLSLLGEGADRVMVFATFASFVALAAGLYRLGKIAFGWPVGLIAATLLCTRFDFPFLAARGYIDVPYLAIVIWAAVLEASRPRRGLSVQLLLVAASLLRPEAWVLAGLYWLWLCWPRRDEAGARSVDLPRAVWAAVLAGVGPVLWVALDYAVTGHPLFSLQHTSGLAEELGRTESASQLPSSTVRFLKGLDKTPVFYASILGLGAAVLMAPRRMAMSLALLVVGVGTFFLVGLAGLSVIDRYLLVPSLAIMVFAGVAIGGWTMLERSRLRSGWMVGSGLLVAYGVAFTATHVNLHVFQNELEFRGQAHAALRRTLDTAVVAEGRRYGPVSTPNHKLIPDARWILGPGATEDEVVARADPEQRARTLRSGVALITTNRSSLLRQAIADPTDDIENAVPPPDFLGPKAESGYYSVYTRKP